MSRNITIRSLNRNDSIDEIAVLIRSAYGDHRQRGWNFNGVDQSGALTAQRVALGVCLVAETRGALIGTIVVHGPFPVAPCQYITREDVAYFQQFAVLPDHQHLGIGSKLLEHAEACAREAGYCWLSTDTADAAVGLLSFYSRCGYAPVTTMQWPGKTYRSVVLSKRL